MRLCLNNNANNSNSKNKKREREKEEQQHRTLVRVELNKPLSVCPSDWAVGEKNFLGQDLGNMMLILIIEEGEGMNMRGSEGGSWRGLRKKKGGKI